MKTRDFLIVGTSVLLSLIGCGILIHLYGFAESRTIRASRIELVDKSGVARLIIGMEIGANGADQPEIVMKDKVGREEVGVLMTPAGKGKIVFNTDRTEAKVTLGFLSESDVSGEAEESGSWGIRIRGPNGETKTVGLPVASDPTISPK